ncbi:MAG: endonuclease domain-containing protein [candidate division WOR-3 bacterium]|nr:endonuclease domain-containing protein [candidate division WOR-3 bacterium]
MVKGRLTEIAKNLRKRSTDAERTLWKHLRARQIDGLKFRRQEPIGQYVLDFICYEKGLVIELDGGQHSISEKEDAERDIWLKQQGFKVVRFWNNEVLMNINGVLEVIRKQCLTPSPHPSHQWRGNKGSKSTFEMGKTSLFRR